MCIMVIFEKRQTCKIINQQNKFILKDLSI